MHVCLRWYEAFNKMEYGGVPIIAALQGAVVGGGLESAGAQPIFASSTKRLIFIRLRVSAVFLQGWCHHSRSDLIGKSCMIDMILLSGLTG